MVSGTESWSPAMPWWWGLVPEGGESLHIRVLTRLLTEVTLRVLGAGDLWVTGVTPLLRMLFGVPGPASCSLEPDEPVLPLSAKEYSDFKMEAEQRRKTQSGKSFQENNGNMRTPSGAHVVQCHLSDSKVFVIELTSPPFFLPTAHQHTPSQPSSLQFFQLTMLVLMLPLLRLLLTFSPPDTPYLPFSVYPNLPHPSRAKWSPASPVMPSLSITGLVNLCSTQFLVIYSLCQTM